MTEMAEMLIERAAAVIAPRRIGDHLIGDVGCALVTDQGNLCWRLSGSSLRPGILRRSQRHRRDGDCG